MRERADDHFIIHFDSFFIIVYTDAAAFRCLIIFRYVDAAVCRLHCLIIIFFFTSIHASLP